MYDNYVAKYITPLLAPQVATKPVKHVTFQLPKIEEEKKIKPQPKPRKPMVSQAHTRKTVLS